MIRLIWIVLMILALLWSMFCWFAASVLGSGAKAVATMTRLFGFDPASTQWLGDTLAMISGPAQIVVGIGWLIGMAILGMAGVAGARAASGMQAAILEGRRHVRNRQSGENSHIVEGTISSRQVEPTPGDDRFAK